MARAATVAIGFLLLFAAVVICLVVGGLGTEAARVFLSALAFSSLRLMTELGKQPQRASASAPCFEIAFTTPDVEAAVQKALAAGARLVQAPEHMPWGQTVAYVADLNDALVELCTPVAPPAKA